METDAKELKDIRYLG